MVELVADFLRKPQHHWIRQDRDFRDSLIVFFSRFPERHLRRLFIGRNLLLLYCNQKMSCTFHQYRNAELVLVFPDLYRLLLSAKLDEGYAILAHELGHVFHGHSRRKISMLDAQLQADHFAWQLGYGEDLLRALQPERATEELAVRLIRLAQLIHT